MPSIDYYLKLAEHVATGSRCVRRKVGAVIEDPEGRIVSTGYNGTPRGMPNGCEENEVTKPTVIHAELNAILFAKQDLRGCTLYVTTAPCLHCSALIIQTGITQVFYKEAYRDMSGVQYLLDANIQVIQWK